MSPTELRQLAAEIEGKPRPFDYITKEEQKAIILALRFHAELLETTRP
jgi:hypothetical protein